MNESRDL